MRRAAVIAGAVLLSACSQAPTAPRAPALTWDAYQAIQPGMTYAQVTASLRSKGEYEAANEVAGQTVRVYRFGDSSADCLVYFAGDRVIDKSTSSLKPPPL